MSWMTTVFQCRECLSCVVYLEESLEYLGCAESVRTDESAWTVSTFQKPRESGLCIASQDSQVFGVSSVSTAPPLSTISNVSAVSVVSTMPLSHQLSLCNGSSGCNGNPQPHVLTPFSSRVLGGPRIQPRCPHYRASRRLHCRTCLECFELLERLRSIQRVEGVQGIRAGKGVCSV